MIQTRQPVSFIATDRPDAAQAFYKDVMGLELRERSDFALVFADGDHVLRVQIVPELTPAGHTVHGWQVSDIAQEVSRLASLGVPTLRFEQLPQDAQGVWTTPDGHQIAWFHDPCGNVLSFTQYADA